MASRGVLREGPPCPQQEGALRPSLPVLRHWSGHAPGLPAHTRLDSALILTAKALTFSFLLTLHVMKEERESGGQNLGHACPSRSLPSTHRQTKPCPSAVPTPDSGAPAGDDRARLPGSGRQSRAGWPRAKLKLHAREAGGEKKWLKKGESRSWFHFHRSDDE